MGDPNAGDERFASEAAQLQIQNAMRDVQVPKIDWTRLERVVNTFHKQHAAMLAQLDFSPILQQAEEIARANERVFVFAESFRNNMAAIAESSRIHSSWIEELGSMPRIAEHIQVNSLQAVAETVQRLTVSEQLFAGVDFCHLADAIRLPSDTVRQLQLQTKHFAHTFDTLAESVLSHSELTALPSFVMPSASREILLHGRVLHAISPAEEWDEDESAEEVFAVAEQEVSGCLLLLEKLDPQLVEMYQGAKEALENRQADYPRHVLVSLREMLNHVLRCLAPEELVAQWAESHDSELFDYKGKPTRRARFLYICRGIGYGPLSEFVQADVGVNLKVIDVLHRVHKIEPSLTDRQLWGLIARVDSLLVFLLQIGRET